MKRICTIDIESNGLLDQLIDFSEFPYKLNSKARLWTVVITDFNTRKSVFAEREGITKEWLKNSLEPYDVIVAHNGHKFDLIALQLFGVLEYKIGWFGENDICFGREVRFFDSLILSRLFDPNRYGGHSLQSWGERVGNYKDDYRQQCIDEGYIEKNSSRGAEFKIFNELLTPYCIQDTLVTLEAFKSLLKEWGQYKNWEASVRQEHILADVSIKREVLGFYFDKELAIENLEKLTELIDEAREKVNPFLPPKPMNKGELKFYTPPKIQLTKGGTPSANMIKFVEKVNGTLKFLGDGEYEFHYEDKVYKVPFTEPIKTHTIASIEDLDHVKETLINNFGWVPTEWRVRDLTKDSKKQNLSLEKRQNATLRWLKETSEGKFKKLRVEGSLKDFKLKNPNDISEYLLKAIEKDAPVRIRTSPSIKVGVERELCPNLIKLGDKVAFAKYFADYLTYRNRKSAIAGGDIEDMDFDEDVPNTGYLSMYREVDGRIPTPAIEIGAISNRYRHIGVVNIPRVTSLFGEEMRRLFGCGEGFVQLGFDYASLENRVQGHYVFPYEGGEELAKSLVAEKPNDSHCFSEDTEILTSRGWKFFGELSYEDEVAQFEKGSISFVKPSDIIYENYEGDMYFDPNSNLKITPNHRMYYESYCEGVRGNNPSRVCIAEDFTPSSDKRLLSAGITTVKRNNNLTENEIKLLVAIQADGSLAKDCSAITFSFTRKDKIERMSGLLKELSAPFKRGIHSRKGRDEISFRLKASSLTVKMRSWLGANKEFTDKFLNMSFSQINTLIEEIKFWDGTVNINGDVILDTTCKETVSVVQTLCTLIGRKCKTSSYDKKKGYKIIHRAYISKNSTKPYRKADLKFEKEFYSGKIGCVTVPSGLIVVRKGNIITISGNSLNAQKMGIDRGSAKSVGYGILYGCNYKKLMEMLGVDDKRALEIYNSFWDAVPALKAFKEDLEKQWEMNNKEFIYSIDGRKILTRSKHSLLNFLFQSSGVIIAKYATIFIMEDLERQGLCIDPFVGRPDVKNIVDYHDENQLVTNPSLIKYKIFSSKEEGEEFVKNWDSSKGQLSALTKGKEKFFVALPNVVSISIENAIKKVEQMLNTNVNFGMEWIVGRNWADCH